MVLCYFFPYCLLLIWSCLQGVSRKGYVSKPPVPEDRQANRLRDETVKKKKNAVKEAAARKRDRKEKHAKACKIAQAEGAPRLPTPESTEEEDSSSSGFNFSELDDLEVVMGASPTPTHRGAGDEGSSMVLGEARLAPGSLVVVPVARTKRRSPMLAAGQRSPAPAVGRRSPAPPTGQRLPSPAPGRRTPAPMASTGGGGSTASAETAARKDPRLQADPRAMPSGQSLGGVSVPRARRSGTGKRSMSARSE